MDIKNIFLAMALLCFAGLWNHSAHALEEMAQNNNPFAAEDALFWGEEEKIISATKYIKRLREAPAIASVISAEQIRNMGARNLMDILKTVPGIGVSVNFANGHRGIESRGTRSSINSEKVLIMVDGHRLNNLLLGEAAWVFNDMMVENIKRVEVIRGPGSALYGANAFVAVINVITKGVEDIDGVDLLAGGGSFGTQHYDVLFGKDFSGLKIAGTVDYLDTNGPKPHVGSDLLGQSGKTKDWEEKYDLGLKASYEDFSFNGRFVNKDVGPYIGVAHALNDKSETKLQQFFGELSYSRDIRQDLHLLAKAYYDEYHYFSYWELFNEGAIPGYPDGMFGIPESKNRALGAEVQVDYSLWDSALWKANNVTAGILHEYDQQYDARHSTNFNPNTGAPLGSIQDITSWGNWQKNADRRITALYIQDVWKFTPEVEGTFGVRFDHFSDFGNTVNPRAGLIWNFYEKANLKLLYGSAFRAPNFEELYNANNPAAVGASSLEPEKIKTYEASVDYRFNPVFSATVTYFHNDIKEIIALKNALYQNLGGANIDGLEAEFKANYQDLGYGYVNYTWQDPRDSVTGDRLPDVSTHKGNIGVNIGLGKYVNFNSNLLVVGPRPRVNADTRTDLAGYEVLDLTLIFKNFYKAMEIRAAIHNLLDESYFDPAAVGTVATDYPREGINCLVDVRYKF